MTTCQLLVFQLVTGSRSFDRRGEENGFCQRPYINEIPAGLY